MKAYIHKEPSANGFNYLLIVDHIVVDRFDSEELAHHVLRLFT